MVMPTGNYHQDKKKKQKKQSFFSESSFKLFIDKAVYLVAIGAIIGNLPQLLKIWSEKNTQGVSLITWMGFALGSIFWLVYGIVHKEHPIIFTNSILFIIQVLIVIGILLYTPDLFGSL